MCEGVPNQVNFLINEASSTEKGANHRFGESDVHLHADNCAGQNKKKYFLWYFAWRIMNQLHASIVYSFLIAGHIKFFFWPH